MDFKVAGTDDFVTALQLDTKIDGIPADVLGRALSQAKEARLKVLEVMAGALSAPRDEINGNAPKIVSFEIPLDKMGEVIGPKGKNINALQADTGAEISLDEAGDVAVVTIGAREMSAVNAARAAIELIVNPPLAQIGGHYQGKVVGIAKFGAFVNILPGRDGLLHISKIGGGKRIDRVEDVLSMGEELRVVVDDIDANGKLSLSIVTDDSEEDIEEVEVGDESPKAEVVVTSRYEEDDIEVVSFEEVFADELLEHYGDLGPSVAEPRPSFDGPRNRDRRGGRPRRDYNRR